MGRNRRLRMKEWLRQLLENGSVSGLCWEDRTHGIFKIDWKHGSQHGYSIDKDALVFRMWAEHTGKYSIGDPCDPKRWKANFRCALNSLKDVIQLPDRTTVRGANAYRLYLFGNGSKCKKGSTPGNGNCRRRKGQNLNLNPPQLDRTSIKNEFFKNEVHFPSSYQPIVPDEPYPLNYYPSTAPVDYYVSRSPVPYEPLTPESDVPCHQTAPLLDYSTEFISSMLKTDSRSDQWQIINGPLPSSHMNDCNGGIDLNLSDEFELPSVFKLVMDDDEEADSNHDDELMHFVTECLAPSGGVNDHNDWKI